MFSLLNFKSFIIITVLLTILGTSVYIKFLNSKIDSLEEQRISLETQNTELNEKIKQTEVYIKSLKEDYNAVIRYNIELQETSNSLKLQQQELQKKLQKLNFSFSDLVKKHPKMVENIINNGQKETSKCFEELSKHKDCKMEN